MSIGVQFRRLAWAAGIWAAAVPVLASPLFKLTDLGGTGSGASAHAIDARGIVCGTSTVDEQPVPTLFDHGKAKVLAPFPDAPSQMGYCMAINSFGQAAGYAYDVDGFPKGFVWDGHAYTILPSLGGITTIVNGMNAAGDVVGSSRLDSPLVHAFVFRNGKMKDLGALTEDGTSYAMAINTSGAIAGAWQEDSDFHTHAFVDRHGTMRDLGDLGGGSGASTQALAINDEAQIAAQVWPDGGTAYSVIAHKGDVTVIPNSDSTHPNGINTRGHVVGDSFNSKGPWFYDGRKTYALQGVLKGAAGWQLQSAAALNDDDSIAATAWSPDGQSHVVLLTRVK
jgi:probable HAF family extracellular repeat protein